jgi:hypothetical protein
MRRQRYGAARRRAATGCCAIGCAIPVVGLLVLFFTYSANNRPPNLAIPTPTPPADNAWDDFVAAGGLARGIVHKAPASMENPPADLIGLLAVTEDGAKDAAPSLARMRMGFGKTCLCPADRSFESANMGPNASLRELARTNSGVIEYYSLRGRWFDAAIASLDGYEMAVMIPRGGGLIELFVGRACESIALYRFESLLPKLSGSELAVVAARLDRIANKRVPCRDIIMEEGYSTVAGIQHMFRDPKLSGVRNRYEMIASMAGVDAEKRPDWNQVRTIAQFALANKTKMLREQLAYYRKLAEEADGPFNGRSQVQAPDSPLTDWGSIIGVTWPTALCSSAICDVLRVETALYRYHAAHGRYPDSLNTLTPEYLANVPTDPFGQGKPFKYRSGSGGFLLYSVGPDLRDNGGMPARTPAAQVSGDIVAGHVWPKRRKGI